MDKEMKQTPKRIPPPMKPDPALRNPIEKGGPQKVPLPAFLKK